MSIRVQLGELGWSQGELAERLDVHPNTVSGWATGSSEVPKYASAYLDAMCRMKRMAEDALLFTAGRKVGRGPGVKFEKGRPRPQNGFSGY